MLVWIGDRAARAASALALRRGDASPGADLERICLAAHLAPLIDAVNATTKRPSKALWRSSRDRIAARDRVGRAR